MAAARDRVALLLARGDGVLVLYRESLDFGTGGKRLTRIELPLPLEVDAMILRQRRMDGPWTLQLQPKRSSGIIYIESTELPTAAGGTGGRRGLRRMMSSKANRRRNSKSCASS